MSDNIKDYLQKNDIPIKNTNKLFWGTYPYSIKIKSPHDVEQKTKCYRDSLVEERYGTNTHHFFWLYDSSINRATTKYRKDLLIQEMHATFISLNIPDDMVYFSFNQSSFINLYFTNENIFSTFVLSQLKTDINICSVPKNREQLELLYSIPKHTELKNVKYFGEYDTRIKLKHKHDYSSIDEVISNMAVNKFCSFGPNSRIIYVDGKDDQIYVIMMLGNLIAETTKCIIPTV